MRRPLLAALLGLLAGLGVLPVALASGSTTSGTVVLRGSRHGAVTLVISRYTTLSTGNPLKGEAGATVTKAGKYAGYVLTDSSGRLRAGAMRVDHIGFDARPVAVPMTAPSTVLEPGRYRLTLVADGTSEVRIPASGITGSLVLNAAETAKVTAELRSLGTAATTLTRKAVTIAASTTTYVAVKQAYTGAGATQRTCVAARGAFCETTTGTRDRLTTAQSGAGTGETWSTDTLAPGYYAPGGYDAIWQASTAGLSKGAWGFALSVG
jgi:hypothetical protein